MEMTDELGGGGELGGGCQTAVESWKKGLGGREGWGSRDWPDQQHTSPFTSDLQRLRL